MNREWADWKNEFARQEALQERQAMATKFEVKSQMELPPQVGIDFILAGNATFTLENEQTGNHFTFKVVQSNENTPHFVKVLTGPNNETGYTFLGTIFNGRDYRHGKRSPISQEAQSEQVFAWAWPKILNGTLPDQVKIHHEGTCGRCGRKLTDPTSIETGFGPYCRTKM